ncbi:MAG: DUF4190 domain-containing protein [Corynebacterium sp.]|uniref:DUF4190 domain-containing protein n=1 Tax=Corynebacterium sp. TaxID=1720 RepID=UPI0026E0EBD8|nr:DUF4190 domain-containing protein [Corynebacterium sp.]MDO5671180.1 DUF4190 domain-containing protein [Corynebacterium sp.]
MSNPFANNEPEQPKKQEPEQPNYDTYQYPSGDEGTAGSAASTSNDYAGYGGYQEPAYGAAPGGSTWAVEEAKNGVAPWALGVGILALIGGISVFFSGFAFLIGLIGLIVSIVAIVKARKIQGPGRRMGMSVTGLILSILSIVASILFWIFAIFILTDSGMMECFNLSDPNAQQTCINDALDSWGNS